VEGERAEDAARLAIVHVSSHARHRHKVVTVTTLASVSMALLRQNGQSAGRVTTSFDADIDVWSLSEPVTRLRDGTGWPS
jgi:hypothetical protein